MRAKICLKGGSVVDTREKYEKYVNTGFLPAVDDAKRIKAAVRDRGVLIGIGGVYGNVLRIQPPLTISDEEIDTVLAAITEVLET